MPTAMTEIGGALRDRMEASPLASFTIEKAGPVWRVKYRDARGQASVSSMRAEHAVYALATELGLVS